MMQPEAQVAMAGGPDAEAFYTEAVKLLDASRIPYLLGGTFAVAAYTGLRRPAKDLDVFCKAGDYPRILAQFRGAGYATEVEDERWLAKARKGDLFVDVIFNSTIAVGAVTEEWFTYATRTRIGDVDVPMVSPTELFWSKAFVQDRYRYDGADIAHLILKQCEAIDWRRLLSVMEPYWEVLLGQLLNFRFVYPTERQRIPKWLMTELLARLEEQAALPIPQMRVCRGRLFSREDYRVDIAEWGFADVVGEGDKTHG
jgi:hypothetical protein